MKRKDREMDRDFGYEIIDKAPYGILSINDNEVPYSLPLSLVRDGDVLYFHGAKSGKKIEIINKNKVVRIVFVGEVKVPDMYSDEELDEIKKDEREINDVIGKVFTTEYESTIVDGEINEVTEQKEKIEALRLICQKYTPDKMKYFKHSINSSFNVTSVYKISINNISSKRKKFGPNRQEIKK